MANSDKNIVITPNIGANGEPQIVFSGANSTVNAQSITLKAYPDSNGALSFEGSAGQLFSIVNDMTGVIFSVNNVSAIPSIEVANTGLIKLAQYSGNLLVGTGTDDGTNKVQINGGIKATTFVANTFNDKYTSPSISTNTLTLDLSTGSAFNVSLNANITTLTISNVPTSNNIATFVLVFTADGTPRSVTWPASVRWTDGTPPTITATLNKRDVLAFFSTDAGTSWNAFITGQGL